MLTYDLGRQHFYWRMTDLPGDPPNVVPEFCDLSLTFDDRMGLIRRGHDLEVDGFLKRVYDIGSNVGYLTEGSDLAKRYGDEFLYFSLRHVQDAGLPSTRGYEIGAGGCYLMRRFQENGVFLCAIDPSPMTSDAAEKIGAECIVNHYPLVEPLERRSLIVHYDVLEHCEDPVGFLSSNRDDLAQGGLLLFAVPDCGPCIDVGDISMAIHEHHNYFDQGSLSRVVSSAGFDVREISKSDYGDVLFCAATVRTSAPDRIPRFEAENFTRFCTQADRRRRVVARVIEAATSTPNGLGLFVAQRSFPYLCSSGVYDGFKMYDDNRAIEGRYFDGFDSPVQSRSTFLENSPSHLLVLSQAFGERIRDSLTAELEALGRKVEITTFDDVTRLARA